MFNTLRDDEHLAFVQHHAQALQDRTEAVRRVGLLVLLDQDLDPMPPE